MSQGMGEPKNPRPDQKRSDSVDASSCQQGQQDVLLLGALEAAQRLLAISDFETAVKGALEAIGTATGIDRIYILQNETLPHSSEVLAHCPYAWTAPGVLKPSQRLPRFSDPDGNGGTQQQLSEGHAVQLWPREQSCPPAVLPEQDGALSRLAVPIRIDGNWWGIIGLDDCTTERRWSDADITLLETAAVCIGSAIERDRDRQARDAASQAQAAELAAHNRELADRDRILAATASVARFLLTLEDFDDAIGLALQTLGETLGAYSVGIIEMTGEPSDPASQLWSVLYKWEAEYGLSQATPEQPLEQGTVLEIWDWYQLLSRGQSFSASQDEMPEPYRQLALQGGCQTTHGVPIFVAGQYWGLIAFSDSLGCRPRTSVEFQTLETTGACIGGAIEREQLRQLERRSREAHETAERNILLEREQAAQQRAAQLQASNKILSQRDRWLDVTAAVAKQLLSSDNFEHVIHDALRILGEGVGVDRTVVVQLVEDTTNQTAGSGRILYEWDSPFTHSVMDKGIVEIPNAGLEECLPQLLEGNWIGGTIDDLNEPFKSEQVALGVQSTYIVPILLEKKVWGAVSVDHCREKRYLSETEIAVFQTAASCIGSAIQRDQSRQAREAAERTALIERERAARAAELEAANTVLTIRERWLETTTAAASALLSATNIDARVAAALKTIGENLDCDRVFVIQDMTSPGAPAGELGFARLTYEWYSAGQESHIDKPAIRDIPGDAFKDSTKQLYAGKWSGGIVEELDEPERSYQQSLGIKSAYFIPVFIEDKLWGVVGINHCHQAKRLSSSELAVFTTAATCIGSAIYQAEIRRDQAAQERAAELDKVNTAISKTLQTLVTKPQLSDFLGQILREIALQIDACQAHLFLYDETSHSLNLYTTLEEGQVYAGASPNDLNFFHHPIPADINPKWKFISEAKGILMNAQISSIPEEYWWPGNQEWHQAQGHTFMACLPMWAGNQALGLISFAFREPTLLTHKQQEFMQALINQAIVAIQLTSLAEQNQTAALIDERNRLAREIHDTLAQAFTGISLQLEALRGLFDNPDQPATAKSFEQAQAFVRRARNLARQGLSEARRSVHALRSAALETDSLAEALRKSLHQTQRDTNLTTQFHLEGNPFPLSNEIQLNLLRIAQEAITNTLRHANATQLDLTLSFTPQQVCLSIRDNGIGFELQSLATNATGFGLMGIQERSEHCQGECHITSHPHQGTTIEVTLPINDKFTPKR